MTPRLRPLALLAMLAAALASGCADRGGAAAPPGPANEPQPPASSAGVHTPPGGVYTLALSPGGRRLAYVGDVLDEAGFRKYARVWDLGQGRLLKRLPVDDQDQVTGVAFSPDGRLLAACVFKKPLRLWDTATWRERPPLKDFPLRGKRGPFASLIVAFAPDNRRLAASDFEGHVVLWDPDSREVTLLGQHYSFPEQLAFSPNRQWLASCNGEGVKVWDLGRRREHWSFPAHADRVNGRVGVKGCAFRPDNRTLVTAGVDGMVRFWDVLTKGEGEPLKGGVGEVRAMALSPDGGAVAVGGAEYGHQQDRGALRVWDLDTRQPRTPRLRFPGPVECVRYSADGGRLAAATGGRGGRIRVWNVADLPGGAAGE